MLDIKLLGLKSGSASQVRTEHVSLISQSHSDLTRAERASEEVAQLRC